MELNEGQLELLKESKVRGLCAAHSADMEHLLFRLSLYCTLDDPETVGRDYTNTTLQDMLVLTRQDLKKHHPERYEYHKAHFKALNKFNRFRGRIIHCKFVWDKINNDSFKIIVVRMVNKELRLIPVHCTIQEVARRCSEFGNVMKEFAKSTVDIIAIVAQKYPELNKASKSL